MNREARRLIKRFIPPAFLELLKKKPMYGFFGSYPSWQEAQKACTGYDHPAILEKVKNALLKVKHGEAVYERDSVLFDTIQYSWPVLASLLWIASRQGNRLRVLDFGGSLGSSYFQNKEFLSHVQELSWNVVEQATFVQCGREYFEDETLHFFDSIESCLAHTSIDVLFISSTLQYLERPYDFIQRAMGYGFEYILIDRTPFLEVADRLTVQRVRPGIYEASYPAWFFHETSFLTLCKQNYTCIAEFDSLAGAIPLQDVTAHEKGFLFKKL